MKKWIVQEWDWWIYHRAYYTLRRMCESNASFAFLLELQLRDWRAAHPIDELLERSTEIFFNEMKKQSILKAKKGRSHA